ncbi:hypothetical protein EYF80_026611 [Liparis tanakae]|uniref:Uncharacterized protein n=1 Tax=Liparis tanakae TaxID=230148 RepID=A0A4Z2HB75_9TELE|nr:hypothetical protein EYF80_026611 [Liparis tanakae]
MSCIRSFSSSLCSSVCTAAGRRDAFTDGTSTTTTASPGGLLRILGPRLSSGTSENGTAGSAVGVGFGSLSSAPSLPPAAWDAFPRGGSRVSTATLKHMVNSVSSCLWKGGVVARVKQQVHGLPLVGDRRVAERRVVADVGVRDPAGQSVEAEIWPSFTHREGVQALVPRQEAAVAPPGRSPWPQSPTSNPQGRTLHAWSQNLSASQELAQPWLQYDIPPRPPKPPANCHTCPPPPPGPPPPAPPTPATNRPFPIAPVGEKREEIQ